MKHDGSTDVLSDSRSKRRSNKLVFKFHLLLWKKEFVFLVLRVSSYHSCVYLAINECEARWHIILLLRALKSYFLKHPNSIFIVPRDGPVNQNKIFWSLKNKISKMKYSIYCQILLFSHSKIFGTNFISIYPINIIWIYKPMMCQFCVWAWKYTKE